MLQTSHAYNLKLDGENIYDQFQQNHTKNELVELKKLQNQRFHNGLGLSNHHLLL